MPKYMVEYFVRVQCEAIVEARSQREAAELARTGHRSEEAQDTFAGDEWFTGVGRVSKIEDQV